MPRIKSLIVRVEIDTARKAHNCQANGNHRIQKGNVRLKVRNGRGWDHYCEACAKNMIEKDLSKLIKLQQLSPTIHVEIKPPE